MSFDTERVNVGRRPALLVHIELDTCSRTYGNAPCTASGASGAECFNTRATCQDTANYAVDVTPTTIKLSDTLIPGADYINALERANLAPTVINPEKGLGQRASIKLTFADFPDNDRLTDPYIANRSYTAADQGTFFGKLIARHRHYVGRPLIIYSGYIADSGFNISDFQARNYVIETISGPDSKGRVYITAKDILKIADDKRAEVPAASTGLLTADITAGATSLTVTSGTEGEYNAESDYIRINDEIIQAPAANRSANVFSNLTRGAFNTTAKAHDEGDSVQACKHLAGDNPIDLVADLLENYASIDNSYIPTTDWNTERDTWYAGVTINTLITEPEGVTSIINELAEQFFFSVWWDEIDQEIKLKAIKAEPNVGATFTDADNLLADSVRVMREEEKRLSRVIFYVNPPNPIETDDAEDYSALIVQILSDEESAALYGDVRRKVIYGRFVDNPSTAIQTASRMLSRFGDAPRLIECEIDAKDIDIWTGDIVDVDTRRLQDENGANLVTRGQVLSVTEQTRNVSGSHYQLRILESNYKSRYGFIGPNSLNDYDVESEENKASYGFIAPNTGTFDDGSDAYRII